MLRSDFGSGSRFPLRHQLRHYRSRFGSRYRFPLHHQLRRSRWHSGSHSRSRCHWHRLVAHYHCHSHSQWPPHPGQRAPSQQRWDSRQEELQQVFISHSFSTPGGDRTRRNNVNERKKHAPEIAAAPPSSPTAPAAWFAAMATGRSFWFCRIWAEMPWRVWAVSTAGDGA